MNAQTSRPDFAHSDPVRPSSFAQKLRANLPQKIVALICTLILSVVVLSDRNTSIEFEQIPVVIHIPDGFASVSGVTETTVNIRVNGRVSTLRDISRDDLGTIAITPPPRDGNVQVTLQPSMLSLPEGVHIEKFQPEFVGINLEPLETRTLAISTDHAFTGQLLPDFQLGEVQIQPAEIQVSGPRSVISDTSQLYIEPIDLTGKASTFTVNRWVILNRHGLKASSTQVAVTVNIVSKSQQHVVIGVPIVPVNLTKPHSFKPATIDLTLIGDEAALTKVDTANLFVTVDASLDENTPDRARILTPDELSVPNLPKGVGFDHQKLPDILFTVGSSQVPAKPAANPLLPQ